MAPRRAAELFRAEAGSPERFRATLYGALGATGAGHLTDRALAEALAPTPCEVVNKAEIVLKQHPNGLLLEAISGEKVTLSRLFFSTGGGELADENGGVVDAPAGRAIEYGFTGVGELLEGCAAEGRPLWSAAEEAEEDLWGFLEEIWSAMERAVERGIATGGALPGGLKLERKAMPYLARAKKLRGTLGELGRISAYALAVSEENAAGGRIVTAPTCGSCGTLPGVLYHLFRKREAPKRAIFEALATAGLFGACVKANASISGAQVGCQGEIGTACAMAAAAAAQVFGGSPRQIEYAAEMAMEHSLGLTCDPVMGLVQIPCIERNAAAATVAFTRAGYALLGDGHHRVSFDEVVETMYRTGCDMSPGVQGDGHRRAGDGEEEVVGAAGAAGVKSAKGEKSVKEEDHRPEVRGGRKSFWQKRSPATGPGCRGRGALWSDPSPWPSPRGRGDTLGGNGGEG